MVAVNNLWQNLLIRYCGINFERKKMKLIQEYFRVLIFYDFKTSLGQKECLQHLQLAYRDEAASRTAVFR